MEEIILPPDPERMIEGLRDTGYEFETAVADIVDNSVAANASRVDLRLAADLKGRIRLMIADDGDGMDGDGLQLAMRYGAPKRPSAASLGKYGLGLKTASTAFCRRLSVISRPNGGGAKMATWDLDHVAKTGQWSLLLTDQVDPEALELLDEVAPGHSGTVVVWDKVDRLIKDYQDRAGKWAANALKQKESGLRNHMSMVYQRFLDPADGRAKSVTMAVNGTELVAWNPFLTGRSELVADQTVPVEMNNGHSAEFTVRAYILPRGEELGSVDEAKAAKLSSDRQGIYIYRENRLIHDADWLGLFQKEPHYTLLRIEFSFDNKLDEAFHLDIMKSQILLNDDLANWLRDQFLPAPRREANRRYREGEQKKITKKSEGAHDNSNSNIKNREAAAGGATVSVSDPNTGEVVVENPQGKFKLKIAIGSAKRPGEVFIQPVDSIKNGLLFEPALIDQHRAVRVNTSHPYYHKVYVPNFSKSVTMQGMDSLLWALCVAELTTTREATHQLFGDLRYEVSRILEKLVETLPEPEMDQNAAA